MHSCARGITRRLTIPVSAGLLTDTATYFEALTAYRAGSLDPIVATFSDAIETSVANGRALTSRLREIRDSWCSKITARRGAATWRALDVVIGQPVIDTRYLQQVLDVSFPTAQTAIETLESAGILHHSVAGRRRGRVWHSVEVIEALDAFAERAGRRSV